MKHLIGIFLALATTQGVWAQKNRTIPYDAQAVEMLHLGKNYLAAGNYAAASKIFEVASRRTFNQSTSAAVYLSGLAFFYLNDVYFAEERFNKILTEFPASRYVPEAKYHLAVMNVRNPLEAKQVRGLDSLMRFMDTATDETLRADAKILVGKLIFEDLKLDLVARYAAGVPAAHKALFAEAICSRYIKDQNVVAAKTYYATYLAAGGKPTALLAGLFSENQVVQKMQRNILKIGLFLPIHLNEMSFDSAANILERSQVGMQFYEGFQQAIDEYSSTGKKQIYVKVFDTQRDTFTIERQLSELETLYPDVVVGEIYTPQSQKIAAWAERNRVPQINPFSTKSSLIEDREQVFLAHASVTTHGNRMADYAASIGLKKVAVFTDETPASDQMANGFISTFSVKGEVIRMKIADVYKNGAARQIPAFVESLAAQRADGVYIPINNEESAGLILSLIERKGLKIKVMTAPYWVEFSGIDRESNERYNVLYTTSYVPDNDSSQHRHFFQKYLREYDIPPGEYAIQGYDLGKYLLHVLDAYTGVTPLAELIRMQPLYRGIHVDYEFNNTQENQRVHVCEYRRGGEVVKVR